MDKELKEEIMEMLEQLIDSLQTEDLGNDERYREISIFINQLNNMD